MIFTLVGFCFHVFVDYSAWKFERERLATEPYLELIRFFASTTGTMAEQIHNAVAKIPAVPKGQMTEYASQDLERQVGSAAVVLGNIDKHLQEVRAECEPLFEKWRSTIAGMSQLSWRLRARFFLLWVLDIAFPLALAGLAILKTAHTVPAVFTRLLS